MNLWEWGISFWWHFPARIHFVHVLCIVGIYTYIFRLRVSKGEYVCMCVYVDWLLSFFLIDQIWMTKLSHCASLEKKISRDSIQEPLWSARTLGLLTYHDNANERRMSHDCPVTWVMRLPRWWTSNPPDYFSRVRWRYLELCERGWESERKREREKDKLFETQSSSHLYQSITACFTN